MSDSNTTQNAAQDAQQPDAVLDLDLNGAEAEELAGDVGKTCRVLINEVGVDGDEQVNGMPVGMLVNMALPAVENHTAEHPTDTLRAAARMKLEAEALLDKHAPNVEAEALLDA